MQNIFKIDAIRALRSVRVTTERLSRVMKRDALSRKRDFQQIKELNYRLARVIPIIPNQLGTAGVIFGVNAVAKSGGLSFPPLPPFGGLPLLPKGPKGPKGPTGQLQEQQQQQEQKQEQQQEQQQGQGQEQGQLQGQPQIIQIPTGQPQKQPSEPSEPTVPSEPSEPGPQVPVPDPNKPRENPNELEEEARPDETTITEPLTPIITRPDEIKVPKMDPAEIGKEIEALRYLYEQQPAFAGGLFGNILFEPQSKIYERADGYFILVSPNPRQASQTPFNRTGKVKVLPPVVTVLRPEDVAALRSSDEAKVAQAFQTFYAVQDLVQAVFGLRTRTGRTPKPGATPFTKVSKAKINRAINDIKNFRNRKNTTTTTETTSPTETLTKPLERPVKRFSSDAASQRSITAESMLGTSETKANNNRNRKKTYRGSFNLSDPKDLLKSLEDLRRKRRESLKGPTQDELNIMDALRQQGVEIPKFDSTIGPQASAKTLIQPVIIYRNA